MLSAHTSPCQKPSRSRMDSNSFLPANILCMITLDTLYQPLCNTLGTFSSFFFPFFFYYAQVVSTRNDIISSVLQFWDYSFSFSSLIYYLHFFFSIRNFSMGYIYLFGSAISCFSIPIPETSSFSFVLHSTYFSFYSLFTILPMYLLLGSLAEALLFSSLLSLQRLFD